MLKGSLFERYIKERQNLDLIETEDGFVAYKITGEECFLANICIEPEKRKQGFGKFLVEKMAEIAKESGCKFITATIHTEDPGCSNTLIAALKCGFVVVRAEAGTMVIFKEIKGEENG